MGDYGKRLWKAIETVQGKSFISDAVEEMSNEA